MHKLIPSIRRRSAASTSSGGRSRTRWAAIGAAVAVTLGAGGLGLVNAQTSPSSGLVFVPNEPCRLVDTRAASQVGSVTGPIQSGASNVLSFDGRGSSGNCNLPADAEALSVNITGVQPSQTSFYTVYPEGTTLPTAATWSSAPSSPRRTASMSP